MNNYKLFENINIGRYTTMKLVAIGDLYEVYDQESLVTILKSLKKKKITYHYVGWGANQIFTSTPKKTLIKLKFKIDKEIFLKVHDVYDLPSSIGLNLLQAHARKFNISGWEVFTGIPASLGGAIAMNAGTALGEIGDLVKQVTILRDDLTIEELDVTSSDFNYRSNNFLSTGDLILSAKLISNGVELGVDEKISNYMDYRKSSQPLATFNCGCIFKNADSRKAGQTLDSLGLKGMNYKGLYISEKHANFIENRGEIASGEDLVEFIEQISEVTSKRASIKFELEVKIV